VQVWLNLVDVRCIKCTCKGGDGTSFFWKNKEEDEQYQYSDFGQSSSQSFLFQLLLIEPLIDPKLLQLNA